MQIIANKLQSRALVQHHPPSDHFVREAPIADNEMNAPTLLCGFQKLLADFERVVEVVDTDNARRCVEL